MVAPAPDLVPDEVPQHRARECKRRREPQAEVAGPGQGAGTKEERLSRQRWHKLFEDHAAKQSRIAVRTNEDCQALHSEFPTSCYLPAALAKRAQLSKSRSELIVTQIATKSMSCLARGR